jgi:hypothetical protein
MSASQVKISQAIRMVTLAIRAKKVPMIVGSPAIGKSAIVHHIAKQYNLKVIDMRLSQCDPTDLLGFPQIVGGKAGYVPMSTFPLDTDDVPTGYAGWLLFLDEFTSAPRGVQAAAYKLVLDRMIGQHHLHPKCAIVCAGNKESDGAIVEEMSTALQSRLIHMELVVDPLEWIQWASANDIDHRIISYISFQPSKLFTFKPDHTDSTYASPRTWGFANDFLQIMDVKDDDAVAVLSGTISEGVAREFLLFCDIYTNLPSIADIIAAPTQIRVSNEPSILFALTGSIAQHANENNIGKLMEYVLRLPIEFQVVCLRLAIIRNKALLGNAALQKWITGPGANLF